jgi:8-oxo-dGTP pyrophosphatase MutT (NUDIX family)
MLFRFFHGTLAHSVFSRILPSCRHKAWPLQVNPQPPHAVAAVILLSDSTYLMQLRDNKPSIAFSNCWGLFGGDLEDGESPLAAIRRELIEELGITGPEPLALLGEVEYTREPFACGRAAKTFFLVTMAVDVAADLDQFEGAGRKAFTPKELVECRNIVPWDAYGVLLHWTQAPG